MHIGYLSIVHPIEVEPGADRVEEILRSGHSFLPWIVLMELNYITRQELGEAEADRRYALLRESPTRILWEVREALILTAARLKADHHISFADSLILAYTVEKDAVLVHKDPEFEALASQVNLERLPYKSESR